MERARRFIRWLVTAAFFISLLPVINLNVERLAEKYGWDKLLSEHWEVVISAISSIAENPWFLIMFGTALGGTLFTWGDYFLRHFRAENPATPSATLTKEQILDLSLHIERAKAALDLDDSLTHEGFHEAAALSIKLIKLGIPAPFLPHLKDHVQHDTFNDQFAKYLAAIGPYIRDGNISLIKGMAQAAIEIVYKKPTVSPDGVDGTQPPPNTE